MIQMRLNIWHFMGLFKINFIKIKSLLFI